MTAFITRRVLVSIFILLGASFIMYILTTLAGDPLEDLRTAGGANTEILMAQRTSALMLDVPAPLRFFLWLGGAAKCLIPFGSSCDLGVNIAGQEVTELLSRAMGSTIQLVVVAVILAIIIGVTTGIASALRQHTPFDNGITFTSFLLYALPSFWVAILLKQFFALGYNDFLRDPVIPPLWIAVIAVISGFIWQALIAGSRRRRLTVFGGSAIASALVLAYMSLTSWFVRPGLGPVIIALGSIGIGLMIVGLTAGLRNRAAMLTSGIVVAITMVCYFSLQGLLDISSDATIGILAIITVAVGLAVGLLMRGPDMRLYMRIGALTAVLSSGLILVDRLMRSWPVYTSEVGGRPIATIGSETPGLNGDIWVHGVDSFTHLLLPTLTLMLISFASYTRYSRSGMLDVLNQDYVRTARAKGLPERVVILRHAFRNSLIPIVTLIASDFGTILGGSIIVEQVFSFSGMGALFQAGINSVDPNPVMGYFVVIAVMTIVFNFLADISYSALDPRVRIR